MSGRPVGPPAGSAPGSAGRGGQARSLDLAGTLRIHLVGIGGAGMSGIATILAAMGHRVTGSDRRDSPTLRRLAERGIAVTVGHDLESVAVAQLVAASSAVPPSDPELVEAHRLGLAVVWRVELLAAVCALRRTVAVAGTKGKTTTTAMVAHILEEAGERPSFLVGGDLPGVDGGSRWAPDSPWLVVEADESDGTFLALPAEAAVVTNVEADHLDHYGSMTALRGAFLTFARHASRTVVVGIDTPGSRLLAEELDGAAVTPVTPVTPGRVGTSGPGGIGGQLRRAGVPTGAMEGGRGQETGVAASLRAARDLAAHWEAGAGNAAAGRGAPVVVTCGTSPDAGVRAGEVRVGRSTTSFELDPGSLQSGGPGPGERGPGSRGSGEAGGRRVLRVELPVPGVHNVRNACAALAVTTSVGVTLEQGIAALATYRPVGRRFEWRGELGGVGFVDDYAHVPSAVAATLATARAGGWQRIVAVFQPHLYSRTEMLGAELGRALADADVVVVTDVYGARESPRAGVDGRLVASAVHLARPDREVHYVAERSVLASEVGGLLRPGDLCLSLGAGDVTSLASEVAREWGGR